MLPMILCLLSTARTAVHVIDWSKPCAQETRKEWISRLSRRCCSWQGKSHGQKLIAAFSDDSGKDFSERDSA